MPLMARVGLGDKLLREGCRPLVRDDVTRARQRDDDVVALHFHVEVVAIRHAPMIAQKGARPDARFPDKLLACVASATRENEDASLAA